MLQTEMNTARKEDTKRRVALFLSAGISLGVFVVMIIFFSSGWGGIKQPLEFNHEIHASNGLDCTDCHQFVRELASSGRPGLEICSSCHSDPLGESKAEKILLEYIERKEEIGWNRLYVLPPDVYFSHRRHVVSGEIECQTCHGTIGSSERPPSRPVKISMKKCMACHKERKADNDCLACHR